MKRRHAPAFWMALLLTVLLAGSAFGLPNLRAYDANPFEYPLVPRDDDDLAGNGYDVSDTLWGGERLTWWSTLVINDGADPTPDGFVIDLFADGDLYLDYTYRMGGLPADGIDTFPDNGPVTVRGGRHTLEFRIDPDDYIPESDETDNNWAHQFIWTPFELVVGEQVLRDQPPLRTGGWDAIPAGETAWYNCDGLSFQSSGWWNAVYTAPSQMDSDIDCRIHEASTGAQDGFAANIGHSSRPAGYLDAVLVNRNTMGSQTWNVGVVNANDTGETYHAEHIVSQSFPFGDTQEIEFLAGQYMTLHEIEIEPPNNGWVTVSALADTGTRTFELAWFRHGLTVGDLSEAEAATVTGVDGRAVLYADASEPGYYCLALFANTVENTDPCTVSLHIGPGLPDFGPFQPTGWHAPCVPRPAPDGTPALVALPDTLHGGEPNTYYNITVGNFSPVPYTLSSPRIGARIEWDRVFLTQYTFYPLDGYSYHRYNGTLPLTVPSGRHTFIMDIDFHDDIAEGDETNNAYGEQFCWSPTVLSQDVPTIRALPPNYMKGSETVGYAEPFYGNCDGLRMIDDGSWWQGVALISEPGGATSFTQLELYETLTGTKNGFDVGLASCSWASYITTFCLVNFNMTTHRDFDVGIQSLNTGELVGTLVVETMSEAFLGNNPEGTFGPFTLASGHLLNLHELALDAGQWAFRLNNLSGLVNWGIGLYPANRAFMGKLDYVEDGIAFLRGYGQSESIGVTLADPGYYCLAVWGEDMASLDLAGDYELEIQYGVSPVPEGNQVPKRTALVGVKPNPANPRTEVSFEMAFPGMATLKVYDVAGRLVRSLVHQEMAAGRHTVVWDGCDESGRAAASGTYCLRLEAGSVRMMEKVSLVR